MDITTVAGAPMWTAFAVVIAAMLALDLGVFHRKAHVVRVREAAIWTVVWIALSLAFNVLVWWRFGRNAAEEFLTGYAIEKALSVDNLFVIYVVFASLNIPREHQHRILFWGILGAVVMRTGMVFAGASLLSQFHWLMYVFGGFLVLSGVRMLARHEDVPHAQDTRVMRFLRRRLPVSDDTSAGKMFIKREGKRFVTPLFLALLMIELSDAVFAVDSIFAIFAITLDPFIVLTSNIFALLGLRSLYFVLSGAAQRFRFVQPGLALVLVFVGIKMAVSEWIKVPVLISLAVIVFLVGGSIVASLVFKKKRRPAHHGASS